MNKKIILASASPRRRELLTQIGLDFEVVVSETEEKITSTEPAKVVEELSAQKAEAVWEKLTSMTASQGLVNNAERLDEGSGVSRTDEGSEVCAPEEKSGETIMAEAIVLGADTVVASDGKILGKPKNTEDAARMLTMLQGRGHEVYTGVTILYEEDGEKKALTFHEKTTVHFYPMTEEQIREYVATGDPMDKAGAYGIQGFCARYIRGIDGDYNNVVGLPAGRVYQELHRLRLV